MNWAKVSFKLKERGRRLSRAPNNPDANKAAVDILFGIAEALDAGLKDAVPNEPTNCLLYTSPSPRD